MKKKVLALALAVSMTFSLAMPVMAEEDQPVWLESSSSEQAEPLAADGLTTNLWSDIPQWDVDHPVWTGDAGIAAYSLDEEAQQSTDETATQADTEEEKPQPGDMVYYNDQIAYLVNEDGETCTVGYNTQVGYPSGKIEIPSKLGYPGYSFEFTVTAIAPEGFAYCDQVTEASLPDTLENIGAGAFYSSGIRTIYIPASVTSIQVDSTCYYPPTFSCPLLPEFVVDENNPNYTTVDGVLFNKEKTTLIQYPAGKAADSYTIPDGVTKILAGAFVGTGAAGQIDHFNVTFPDSVTQIEGASFLYSVLTSVSLPAGLKAVFSDEYFDNSPYPSAFSQCPLLAHIEMRGDSETFTVKDDALIFHDGAYEVLIVYAAHKDAEEYVMPENVTVVAAGAFYQVPQMPDGSLVVNSLKKIQCSPNLTEIAPKAFECCISVESITLPRTLKLIRWEAFNEANNLKDVYYEGAEEDKAAIQIESHNNELLNATWHYESLGPDTPDSTSPNEHFVIDDVEYAVNADNTACSVYKYTGSSSDVIIPESVKELPVTEIADHAFVGCKSLDSVALPDSITQIGDSAFIGCENLKDIKLPQKLERIGTSAFAKCQSLKEVNLPDTVVEIGNVAFNDCDSLNSIRIPEQITKIGEATFVHCDNLKDVTLPQNLESIGLNAFAYCTSLEKIVLPAKLKLIEDSAFQNTSLADVYYAGTESDRAKIEIQGENDKILNATWHYESLGPDDTPDPVDKWTYDLEDGTLTISGKGVLTGYSSASQAPWYAERANVQRIVIEDGITSVGDFDFYGMPNLTSVTLADSVVRIGEYAFKNCTALENVELPANLTDIEESAFYGCTAFDTITIPTSVETIRNYAFARCAGVSTINFEGSAPEIGNYTFSGVTASVNYPEEDSSWNDKTKKNYGGKLLWDEPLAWELKDGVLTIADDSCMTAYGSAAEVPWNNKRSDITRVVLKDGVTKIADFAFYGCENLTNIEIPASVTSIGGYAFKKCSSLSDITLPEALTTIGESAFYGCTSLTEITIPAAVTKIGDYAFARDTSLSSIIFNGNAPEIAGHAFSGVTANASCTDSWTDADKQSYGGKLTWNSADNKLPCGKETYWEIVDGVLTISGKGAMDNYDSAAKTPWYGECANIKSVVVEDGVTNAGDFAFYGMTNLTSVSLADSVTTIGGYAFKNDSALAEIELPANLPAIKESAFYGCSKLSSIEIPATVTAIDDYAFSRCTGLKTICFTGDAPKIANYAFNRITATITYPAGNATWTDTIQKNYGGTIQWSAES